MLGFIKEHPYMTAGGVFVVGLILVFALSGSSGEPIYAAADNSSSVAAGTALQMATLEAQTATNISGQQAAVQTAAIAAQIELAKLQRATDSENVTASREVALAGLAAQKDTQVLIASLSAQTAQQQINANVNMTQILATSQEVMLNTIAGVQKDATASQERQANTYLQTIAAINDSNNALQKHAQTLEYQKELQSKKMDYKNIAALIKSS